MKRVVIVKAGGHLNLSAEAGDYDEFCQMLKDLLEGSHGEEVRVEVVESVGEAEQRIRGDEEDTSSMDVVIFVTRGMLSEADRIKTTYPFLKVVLFTGDFPEDRVILINKGWMLPNDTIRDVILGA